MSGEIWDEVCESFLRTKREIVLAGDVPNTPRMRAEGMRFLGRFLSGGILLCSELADPDYPELGRMYDTTLSWGIDNPDTIYLYSALRGDATYRIYGNRGTAHHFDVQVQRGHFAEAPDFSIVSTANGSELEAAPDGTFELVLSPERHEGNWLELEPDAEWLCIRQYFYDWESERPADLIIERVGAAYPPPPVSSDQIAARLDRLQTWFNKSGRYWDEMARFSMERTPNEIYFRPPEETAWGGLRGLAYGFGNFRCEPEEAVILEVKPPLCHYWSFSLGNWYWETVGWTNRQSSLNGHQAQLDADGVFRVVIAHEDPGVFNWLDPAGNTVGTVMGRYLLTEAAPSPKSQVVKLSELDAALPADTPRVTPEQRREILRQRERAAHQRNRH
jgi:hypothetical protein